MPDDYLPGLAHGFLGCALVLALLGQFVNDDSSGGKTAPTHCTSSSFTVYHSRHALTTGP